MTSVLVLIHDDSDAVTGEVEMAQSELDDFADQLPEGWWIETYYEDDSEPHHKTMIVVGHGKTYAECAACDWKVSETPQVGLQELVTMARTHNTLHDESQWNGHGLN